MPPSNEQRKALIGITALAKRELFDLWSTLEGLGATETRDALAALLPDIGDRYGAAAAALAADWYDDLRDLRGVRGAFQSEPAGDVDVERWRSLAGWGVSPLFGAEPDPDAALTLIQGGLHRTVADRHRLTVVENSIRDPRARGWERHGSGASCDFCRMLLSRGAVYTEATGGFESHDHCNCYAAPAW